jgi:hypothetical protein
VTGEIIMHVHPDDGRHWECQCARCGSSLHRERCTACEDGLDGHDCGDDSCCCLDPEPNRLCGTCGGHEGWWVCLSDAAWCEANPLPGREDVKRGLPEFFPMDREPSPADTAANTKE